MIPAALRPSRPLLVVALLAATAVAAGLAASGAAPPPADPADAVARSQAAARERAAELAESTREGGPLTAQDARGFLELALVDPERFAADGAFRARVLEELPTTLPAAAPPELRDRILHQLETGPGLTFPQSEALELAWGAARRPSAARRVDLGAGDLAFPDETRDPVTASILSFPSAYLAPEDASELLVALRLAAPERELVVLADLPMSRALEGALEETAGGLDPGAGVHRIETYGRPYSPWPRDPFATARLPGGGLVLVERPAFQGGREGDRWMAREVVQNLSAELDRAWGGEAGVRWGEAPFFFHNGHVLTAGGAVWTSLHGLEHRTLEILGLDRVPVETFGTAEGIDRYLEAARRAADGMAAFYGKPVRPVHPLPRSGPGAGELAERTAGMRALGGGAGFDLDSLVTLLPFPPGEDGRDGEGSELQALVGDLDLGRELLGALGPEDRRSLRATYGFAPPAGDLPEALAAFQSSPRAAGLDAFLELTAEHLAASGLTVRRLPLILAPVALLEDREVYPHGDFLIGWQNAVLDPRDGGLRAEGFASGIPAGDEGARAVYREAGAELVLLPPLVRSVILNGGLRCASNQIRARGPTPSEGGTPGVVGGGADRGESPTPPGALSGSREKGTEPLGRR